MADENETPQVEEKPGSSPEAAAPEAAEKPGCRSAQPIAKLAVRVAAVAVVARWRSRQSWRRPWRRDDRAAAVAATTTAARS